MNRFRRYFAARALTTFLILPAVLRADCPEGTRDTAEAERQEYTKTVNALKAAVPPAPAGWQLQAPKFEPSGAAPTYTCKGSGLTADPIDLTYFEPQPINPQDREREARIAALRKLSPDEQKQVDDINRQAWQLKGPMAAAKKNHDLAELARLNEQYNQTLGKAGVVYQAHADKIAPEIAALNADLSKPVNLTVKVRVQVGNFRAAGSNSAAEKIQIPGVPQAFYNNQTLDMSFGRDAAGHDIRVWLTGDRERVLTIARLFAESSLRTLAAK